MHTAQLPSTSTPLQTEYLLFHFCYKKNSPKNNLHLILVFYIKLWKVSHYYYVSTNSITLWILVNPGSWWKLMVDPGGSQWWILVDPNGGSWWIPMVDPGGSPWWILVDPNCGSWWLLVEPISGSL